VKSLILEDEPSLLEDLGDCIKRLEPKRSTFHGKASFDVDGIRSAAEAKVRLRAAGQRAQPYDVLLLDLAVPEHSKGTPSIEKGLEVLKLAKEGGGTRAIVVVSGNTEAMNSARRLGVTHFVNKQDFRIKDIELAVRTAVTNNSRRILEGRIRDLAHQSERSLAYHFGLCFSRCLQDVDRAGHSVESAVRDRLGLHSEQDNPDFLIHQIQEIHRSLQSGRQNWAQLRMSLGLSDLASPQQVDVHTIMKDLEDEFSSCLFAKNATLDIEQAQSVTIVSFNSGAKAILSEMVLGALADVPDASDKAAELIVSNRVEGDWVNVVLHDNLTPLSHDDASRIDDGIHCGPLFSRAWGLSVMQQVALSGGGRLMAGTNLEGNEIKYRIPHARNA
jgi:CheY-like chemotaxis protein